MTYKQFFCKIIDNSNKEVVIFELLNFIYSNDPLNHETNWVVVNHCTDICSDVVDMKIVKSDIMNKFNLHDSSYEFEWYF